MKPLFEDLPYTDAEEFLRDLSPLAPIWTSTGFSLVVFSAALVISSSLATV